jgi:hypothetical protein
VKRRRIAQLAVGFDLKPFVERFILPRPAELRDELRHGVFHGGLIHWQLGLNIKDKAAIAGWFEAARVADRRV